MGQTCKKVELLLNCATHETTEIAPILLETGKHPDDEIRKIINFPEGAQERNIDRVLICKRLLSKAQKRQLRHDANKNTTEFTVGQLVWLKANNVSSADDKETKKLFLLYEGPYRIKYITGHNAFCLENPEDGTVRGNFNIIHLKPYTK